jgi:DNA polymerase III epsilon subunit family exonuclease
LLPFITFVAFDVETTGLHAAKDEVIEVAGVKFTLEKKMGKLIPKTLNTYSSLIKPNRFIPEESTRIHNITNEMVEEAPDAKKVLGEFFRFCGLSTVLVAHNAAFDAEFLGKTLKKNSLPLPGNPILDSLKITKKSMVEASSQKLGNLAKKLGNQIHLDVNSEDLHRALYDCEVLREVFTVCLSKRFPEKDLTMDKAISNIEKIHGPVLNFKSYV